MSEKSKQKVFLGFCMHPTLFQICRPHWHSAQWYHHLASSWLLASVSLVLIIIIWAPFPQLHVRPVLLSTGAYCICGCRMDCVLLGNHFNVSDALGAWSHFSDNKIYKKLSVSTHWLEYSKEAWSLWPKLVWMHYFCTSLVIYQRRLPDSCTQRWLSTSQFFFYLFVLVLLLIRQWSKMNSKCFWQGLSMFHEGLHCSLGSQMTAHTLCFAHVTPHNPKEHCLEHYDSDLFVLVYYEARCLAVCTKSSALTETRWFNSRKQSFLYFLTSPLNL